MRCDGQQRGRGRDHGGCSRCGRPPSMQLTFYHCCPWLRQWRRFASITVQGRTWSLWRRQIITMPLQRTTTHLPNSPYEILFFLINASPVHFDAIGPYICGTSATTVIHFLRLHLSQFLLNFPHALNNFLVIVSDVVGLVHDHDLIIHSLSLLACIILLDLDCRCWHAADAVL